MTSIDDLFKSHGQANANKRKFEPITNPDDVYKLAKHTTNGDAKGHIHKSVDDEVEGNDEDSVAGPELLPDDEDDEGNVEDEEGRFFGGGVNRNTRDVLDFMDERDTAGDVGEAEKIDNAWLRRTALNFEKRISKNAELRAKFEDEPAKFMASEGDLDADIKALSILTDHPELYSEFARLGCVNSLVSLLAHDNTDIAINAIEILSELTDEDVQAGQEQWDALVDAMLKANLPDLLVQNFSRLDEANESDRSGVYHSLGLLENLASQSTVLDKALTTSSPLSWLLKRIQRQEPRVSQNTQYAAEILSIILQSSAIARTAALTLSASDTLLQILSGFRKRDPAKDSSEEEEYAENVFDALTCLLDDTPGGQADFLAAEGTELALLMLRASSDVKFAKPRALRLLDHAMSGSGAEAIEACERLVEAAGLKPLFALFMKTTDQTVLEHILGVFASLLRQLPSESAARIRTLAKFMEKQYEKVERLVRLRGEYRAKLARADARIEQERQETVEEEKAEKASEWLGRRLDAGLFTFQTIDVVLAWLVAEDDGAKTRVQALLSDKDADLKDVSGTLVEQLEGLEAAEGGDGQDEELSISKDMLKTLVACLGG